MTFTSITNGSSARAVAASYIEDNYEGCAEWPLSVLRLTDAWLVEAAPAVSGSVGVTTAVDQKILLMVDRFGQIRDLGSGTLSRSSSHRYLAGLRAQPARRPEQRSA